MRFVGYGKMGVCVLILCFSTRIVLCVAYRPDGKEVAVATLNGHITFFDPSTGHQVHCIEGRNDLSSGRAETDIITAKKSLQAK